MSKIDQTLKLTRAIESRLTDLGAQGRGMHEKVSSIEKQLSPELIRKLRWIATLRNKTVHEDGFKIDDFGAFRKACNESIKQLEQMGKSQGGISPIKLALLLIVLAGIGVLIWWMTTRLS